MQTWRARVRLGLGIAAIVAAGSLSAQPPIPGEFPDYDPPRTADGHPDLNGIWQAMTTANWDIEAHGAASGPYPEILGAWGAQPAISAVRHRVVRQSIAAARGREGGMGSRVMGPSFIAVLAGSCRAQGQRRLVTQPPSPLLEYKSRSCSRWAGKATSSSASRTRAVRKNAAKPGLARATTARY